MVLSACLLLLLVGNHSPKFCCACTSTEVERVPGTPEEGPCPIPQGSGDVAPVSDAPAPVPAPIPEATTAGIGMQAQLPPVLAQGAGKPATAHLVSSQSRTSLTPQKSLRTPSRGARASSLHARQGGPGPAARASTPPLDLQRSSFSPHKQQLHAHAVSPPVHTEAGHQRSAAPVPSSPLKQPTRQALAQDTRQPERGALPLTIPTQNRLASAPSLAPRAQKGTLPLTRSPSPKHELLAGACALTPAEEPLPPPPPFPAMPTEQPAAVVLASPPLGMHPGLQAVQLRKQVAMTVEDKMDLWNASRVGITPPIPAPGPSATTSPHPSAPAAVVLLPAVPAAPAAAVPAGAAASPRPDSSYPPHHVALNVHPSAISSTPQADLKKALETSNSGSGTPYDEAMFRALDSIERRYHMEQGRAGVGQQQQQNQDLHEIRQPIVLHPPPLHHHHHQQQQQQEQAQQQPHQQQQFHQQPHLQQQQQLPQQPEQSLLHQHQHPGEWPKLPSIDQKPQPTVLYPPPQQQPASHQQEQQQRLRVAAHWLSSDTPVLPPGPPLSVGTAPNHTAHRQPNSCPDGLAAAPCPPDPSASAPLAAPIAAPAAAARGHNPTSPCPPPAAPFQFPVSLAPLLPPSGTAPHLTTAALLALQHSQPSGVPPGAAVFQPLRAQQSQSSSGERARLPSLPLLTQLGQRQASLPLLPSSECVH
eukprot:980010-Pelagomonas_calceolata.AAC.4